MFSQKLWPFVFPQPPIFTDSCDAMKTAGKTDMDTLVMAWEKRQKS